MSIAERIEQELMGQFWTRLNEMVDDIVDMGLEVLEANDEYIVVADDDEEETVLYLGLANSTRWIERIKEA